MFSGILGALGGASSLLGQAGGLQNELSQFTGQTTARGVAGGIEDLLSQILGGRDIGKGFGDIESQLRAAMGGQQQALQGALGGLAPFQQGGAQATQQELGLLQGGQDPTGLVNQILGQFQQSPAQKFAEQQGLTAVQNRLEAQGLGQSGAQREALEKFAQGTTSAQQQQFLQNVLGARGQQLGALGGLAGRGLGAAETGGQFQLQSAQNIADLLESLGQTQAAGETAKAGGTSGIIGSIGSILSNFL